MKESLVITKATKHSGTTRVSLKGDLTVKNAGRLRESLLAAVKESQPIEIHLKDIQRIDVTALQLLISAKQSSGKNGKMWELKIEDYAYLTGVIKSLGFTEVLISSVNK